MGYSNLLLSDLSLLVADLLIEALNLLRRSSEFVLELVDSSLKGLDLSEFSHEVLVLSFDSLNCGLIVLDSSISVELIFVGYGKL